MTGPGRSPAAARLRNAYRRRRGQSRRRGGASQPAPGLLEDDQLVEAYVQGASIRALAGCAGYPRARVRSLLRDAGVALRAGDEPAPPEEPPRPGKRSRLPSVGALGSAAPLRALRRLRSWTGRE